MKSIIAIIVVVVAIVAIINRVCNSVQKGVYTWLNEQSAETEKEWNELEQEIKSN